MVARKELFEMRKIHETSYMLADYSKAELRLLAEIARTSPIFMIHDTIMIEIPRINRGWVWN